MRMWSLILPLVLIALTTTPSGVLGDEVTVVNSQFQVAAGKSACSSLNVSSSASAAKIVGSAAASGGSHNDIRVLVIKDQKVIVYDSGRLQSAKLNVRISEPGAYALCFDNTFSLVSSKTVRASIKLVSDTTAEKLSLGFAAGLGALSALGDVLGGKPVDQAISRGLSAADGIFNDINWSRLRGYQRALPNWRVVGPSGAEQRADLEIVFVSDYHETDTWCRGVLEALYKQTPHPAWGCTRPGPPWRIVAIDPHARPETIAHEIWHTKGYWGHVQLKDGGTWPSNPRTGQAAPYRTPRPDD